MAAQVEYCIERHNLHVYGGECCPSWCVTVLPCRHFPGLIRRADGRGKPLTPHISLLHISSDWRIQFCPPALSPRPVLLKTSLRNSPALPSHLSRKNNRKTQLTIQKRFSAFWGEMFTCRLNYSWGNSGFKHITLYVDDYYESAVVGLML